MIADLALHRSTVEQTYQNIPLADVARLDDVSRALRALQTVQPPGFSAS